MISALVKSLSTSAGTDGTRRTLLPIPCIRACLTSLNHPTSSHEDSVCMAYSAIIIGVPKRLYTHLDPPAGYRKRHVFPKAIPSSRIRSVLH